MRWRYSVTSLIAIVVVATALTWLYRTLAVRMLIRYETFSAAEPRAHRE